MADGKPKSVAEVANAIRGAFLGRKAVEVEQAVQSRKVEFANAHGVTQARAAHAIRQIAREKLAAEQTTACQAVEAAVSKIFVRPEAEFIRLGDADVVVIYPDGKPAGTPEGVARG